MLKSLLIKNFALIDSLEIEFSRGLNIITGETGAGKSVIVEALLMALGERASSDLIREGEKKAIIEGVFKLSNKSETAKLLSDNQIENNEELIIRRELNDKGNSRCFINDSPVNLALLKIIGDLLVDFHGQHDHQLLLNRETHITLLDIAAGFEKQKEEYLILYHSLYDKIHKLRELRKNESLLKSREESIRFELNEIEKIGPKPGEESLLEQELNIIQNSEQLHNLVNELNTVLSEDENSIYTQLYNSSKILVKLNNIEPKFKEYSEELSKTTITINEIIKFSNNYLNGLQFDQARIDEIRERLLLLRGLRKKYGTYNAIFDRNKNLEKELNLITNYDKEINELEKEIINLKLIAGEKANQLSELRKKVSNELDKSVIQKLKTVGIENSIFRTVITCTEIENGSSSTRLTELSVIANGKEYITKPEGIDDVEFYISTNKGETPKPLVNIASGGEISRVMLTLKSIVANSDKLPILVFDEIDIGISGRIAQKVGTTMKDISRNHQIIAITHLPQIAALGDRNMRVEKKIVKGRTLINCKFISEQEKVEEIARLISGEKITETSLKTASELINNN